jgi:hypothetical protein
VKLRSLAIDCAGALDGYIDCVDGEEQRPVSIVQSGVAGERNCIDGVIVLSIRGAEKFSRGSDVQGDVAFEFDCADLKRAGGNQYDSSAILMACIYSRLNGGCVECSAVSFRSVLANVVDVSAEIICTGVAFYLLGCKPSLSRKTTSQ